MNFRPCISFRALYLDFFFDFRGGFHYEVACLAGIRFLNGVPHPYLLGVSRQA